MNAKCNDVVEKMIENGWEMLKDGIVDIKEHGDEFVVCMYDEDALEYIVEFIIFDGEKYNFKYVAEFFNDEEDALEYFAAI